MRQFGLIGLPLTHSFSKKYFTEKFRREARTDCTYDLYPLPAIDEFPRLLAEHPSLEGLNVTIPYKKQVLSFLDQLELPRGLHACNCIRIRNGKKTGFNTDVTGFEKSLKPLLKSRHTQALVLGTGGAAESVLHVLSRLGITYLQVSRSKQHPGIISYDELSAELVAGHPLLINTTPLGTYPDTAVCPPLPYEGISEGHLLYDLVYNPPLTLFLQKGKERGATVKNGEEMLVIQAEESWRIWNEH